MKRTSLFLCSALIPLLFYSAASAKVDPREVVVILNKTAALTNEAKSLVEKLKALPDDINLLSKEIDKANKLPEKDKSPAFGKILYTAIEKIESITKLALGYFEKDQYGAIVKNSAGGNKIISGLFLNILGVFPTQNNPKIEDLKKTITSKLADLIDQLDLSYFLGYQMALALGYKKPEPGKPVETVPVEIVIPAATEVTVSLEDL